MGVKIVIVAIGGHDMKDGRPLSQTDADMSALCLITLCLLHEWVLHECLFNRSCVDVGHIPGKGIEMVLLQDILDFTGIDKPAYRLVVDVDLHLSTYRGFLGRRIECRDGQQQIDCDDDVE